MIDASDDAKVGATVPRPMSADGPSVNSVASDAALKRRARLGLIALSVRSALQNVVVLVANVYLARVLSPGDYGVFGILQFALSLFKLIGDTGLGSALVQQQRTPDDRDLSSIWWFQLGLGALLVVCSCALVPVLPLIWPTITPGLAWLLPGLSLSLLFTMLRVVPFLMLEREVNFGWVGMLEFLGTLVFYGTAAALAASGAGAAALVWATVGQSALVSIAANLVQPWRPKLIFDRARIRGMLKFGFAFQGNNVVGFINAAVTPLLVGARLGKDAMGIVNFAQSTALFPAVLVTIVRRVYFPLLSRLQHDSNAFARELNRAVLLCGIPAFLFAGLFCGGAPKIVAIIYSEKWMPSVGPLYLYSIGFAILFYSWIASAAIEAKGLTSRIFRIAVISTLTNWCASSLTTWLWPTPFGFAMGYFVHMVAPPIVVYLTVREIVPEAKPLAGLGGLVGGAVLIAVLGRFALPWVRGPISLTVWIIVAILVFAVAAIGLDQHVRELAKETWQKRRSRQATRLE